MCRQGIGDETVLVWTVVKYIVRKAQYSWWNLVVPRIRLILSLVTTIVIGHLIVSTVNTISPNRMRFLPIYSIAVLESADQNVVFDAVECC